MANQAEIEPGESRSDFSKFRHGEKAPLFGTNKEKRVRTKLDPKFNYGGRSEQPDADSAIQPDERAASPEGDDAHEEAPATAFSSRLPGRAFGEGDLYGDNAEARRAAATVEDVLPSKGAGVVDRLLGIFRR